MKNFAARFRYVFAACGAVALTSAASAVVTIPVVPIGNPGNHADSATGRGAVPYGYLIGTTEVTNTQYAAFLNAVARSDPNALHIPEMGSGVGAGISRSGTDGSFTYAPMSGRENMPTGYVNFWSACRFANWLHNGQPNGAQGPMTTEDGAYTLTAAGVANNTVVRNPGAQWFVPSDNEWYKAAYYQPAAQGGDSDGYWICPDSTNGVCAYPFPGVATVGSFPANFSGTYDMLSNVFEWTEAVPTLSTLALHRHSRSSAYLAARSTPLSTTTSVSRATLQSHLFGFRVAPKHPPSTAGACCLGSACIMSTAGACAGPNQAFAGPGLACGPNSATVSCCRGDYNKSGTPTVQDLFDFLADYFAGGLSADTNDNGVISVQDIFDFMAAYFGGCA